MKEIATNIIEFVNDRTPSEFKSSLCYDCNASCCNGPGFSLFENIVEAYKKYQLGKLIKEDYIFQEGLSLINFINMYYDPVLYNNSFLVFYPKILSINDILVSIPPFGSYYNNRDYFFKNNPNIINYGCIFLNKKQCKDTKDIYCILHDENHLKYLTSKPIDCSLLICNSNKKPINPIDKESRLWFALLEYYYPEGQKKYNNLQKI